MFNFFFKKQTEKEKQNSYLENFMTIVKLEIINPDKLLKNKEYIKCRRNIVYKIDKFMYYTRSKIRKPCKYLDYESYYFLYPYVSTIVPITYRNILMDLLNNYEYNSIPYCTHLFKYEMKNNEFTYLSKKSENMDLLCYLSFHNYDFGDIIEISINNIIINKIKITKENKNKLHRFYENKNNPITLNIIDNNKLKIKHIPYKIDKILNNIFYEKGITNIILNYNNENNSYIQVYGVYLISEIRKLSLNCININKIENNKNVI